jgi:pyruvate dehydrogenase E1 component beta subunit
MRHAIIQALKDELESDPSVVLLGEDIGVAGGAFKATEGLLEQFGPNRVRDTPISETAFLGAAIGAACTGLRPVVEMMYIEFLGVALDQLVTEASKLRYLSRGAYGVPLVVRASVGAGLGFGCQHSQVADQWLRATPGLKVVVPSGARTAYGLLRSAIQDPDPVVVLETRSLYGDREEVTLGDAGRIPIGVANYLARGPDLTIVSLGQMVRASLAAVQAAAGSWAADVIDLQTLVPWDRATVTASVERTGRLVVVEEAPYSGGWGSEICDHVSSEFFGRLQAPPIRITTPDVPVPYSATLERRFLPSAEDILDQVTELLQTSRRPQLWWQRKSAHV